MSFLELSLGVVCISVWTIVTERCSWVISIISFILEVSSALVCWCSTKAWLCFANFYCCDVGKISVWQLKDYFALHHSSLFYFWVSNIPFKSIEYSWIIRTQPSVSLEQVNTTNFRHQMLPVYYVCLYFDYLNVLQSLV